jgi:hypothetical protein
MSTPRQENPAEGSREIIERELKRQDARTTAAKASSADVARLLGELDAASIAAILALTPTQAEVAEAAAWLDGESDHLRRPLLGAAAAIFDIVERSRDQDGDAHARQEDNQEG